MRFSKSIDERSSNCESFCIKIAHVYQQKYVFPSLRKKVIVISSLYLRESAPFWAVDASCAHEREGREGRGSPSTMSSPESPSGSRGCCWESLYSFCRLPYHRGPYTISVNIRACDPDGNDEQSSSGMMFTVLHSNDTIRVPERKTWQSRERHEGCFDETRSGQFYPAIVESNCSKLLYVFVYGR